MAKQEHDSEMCFCRKCMERLFRENAEYFKAWLERDKVQRRVPEQSTPKPADINCPFCGGRDGSHDPNCWYS